MKECQKALTGLVSPSIQPKECIHGSWEPDPGKCGWTSQQSFARSHKNQTFARIIDSMTVSELTLPWLVATDYPAILATSRQPDTSGAYVGQRGQHAKDLTVHSVSEPEIVS
ncbi:hypothetical protein E4U55_003376 [Claviceps digitariae]|nr:hypothetical protein E4U55_003376 [Claviceps digitariae]